MGTRHAIIRLCARSISPGSRQPERGAEAGAHGSLPTSHRLQPQKKEVPRTPGREGSRGSTAAGHEKPELLGGSKAPSAGEGGGAGAVRARPGLGAERRPGPTWCPSYLASSGSVKSRTGASAGGLKRSWGSALAAGSRSSSSWSRQGRGSGPRAAAPAMAPSAHRPRPAAREGSGVGPELKEHRGERRGAQRNRRGRLHIAEGDEGA